MKRLIIKATVISASCIGVLIATLLIAFILLVTTESGTRFAWQKTQAFLPEMVAIESVSGRLAGPLNIKGLKVNTETLILELDSLELEWLPVRLFRRVLDIERLEVAGLRYTSLAASTTETEEPSAPFILPEEIELPLEIRLGQVNLADFEFRSGPDEQPFRIDLARLTAAASGNEITLSTLAIDSPAFSLEGKTDLTMSQDYPLRGEIHFQFPVPDYPPLNGFTQFSGTLKELSINQTIAKPYDMRAEVMLRDLLSNLSFEAAVDVNPLKLQLLNAGLPPATVQLAVNGRGTPENIVFTLNGWAEDEAMGRFNTHLAGGFTPQEVSIDELTITVPDDPAELHGSGRIMLESEPQLDVKLDWRKLQWPLKGDPLITSSVGEVKLKGTIEDLSAGIDIAVGRNGTITGIAKRDKQILDVALDWHDLQWPLSQPEVISPEGHIAVTGQVEDYVLNVQAGVVVPKQTDAQLSIRGRGTLDSLDLSQVAISALEGKVEGKAGLRWNPELQGSVNLTGKDLNPGVLLNDWPGKLKVRLRAEGGLQGQKPALQLQQLHVDGLLRGYELFVDAEGAYAEELTVLKQLVLSSGSTRLEAEGTISDNVNVSWQLQSEDLGTLLPKAAGRIYGKGTMAGLVSRPQMSADLNANDLAYADYRLKLLDLDADVDLSGEKESHLSLLIEDGNAAGIELHKITLNGAGDPGANTLALSADTSKGEVDIAVQGKLLNLWKPDVSWDFTLNTLNLKYPELEGWSLQSPASGHISSANVEIYNSCLKSGDAVFCLNGKQSPEGVNADFTLAGLPFGYLSPLFPENLNLQGNLDGKGSFTQAGDNAPVANVEFTTGAVQLLAIDPYGEELNEKLLLVFQPGKLDLQMQKDEVRASMDFPISETDGITLQATIAQDQRPLLERPLQGQMISNIENLDFIDDLIPDVQDLEGRLNGNMVLTGSLGAPALNGHLTLTGGAAKLERPGLYLSDIRLDLTGDADGILRLKAHALSENGELNFDGKADLKGDAPLADITVKGKKFRLINTPEAEIDASPDLTISLNDKRIDVNGQVEIPYARIKLKTLPESAVSVSDDQLIVGSEERGKSSQKSDKEMFSRVRIILGDDVNFEGFGLKARIDGNILAVEKPGEPTTGSGELVVHDGEYRAYGQGLVIEKGRILFAGGPIGQPGLLVRAVRRPVDGITVGVQVRGNLSSPDFTLFSDPSMTQGNQLSYLMLGRPMSGASGTDEDSALSRAALALGLKGGNSVAKKINSTLGLDQFGLASNEAGAESDAENASFVIGKYLSPELYVSYGLGLFEPVSTLRLQYAIGKRWEFVTESSSTASGGDIIYTIETGE